MTSEAAAVTVVQNVRIFDGMTVHPVGSVLIEQGLIADVRPRITPPAGALVVNGRGRTLLPGLIDCHAHLSAHSLEQAAVFGVTTLLSTSVSAAGARTVRPSERTARGRVTDEDLADDVGMVRVVPWTGAGADGAGDVVQVLVATAHARRRLVVAHVTGGQTARRAASTVDGLAHLFVDQAADEEFVEAVARSGAFVIPTLSALESLCGRPSGAELAFDVRLTPYLDVDCRNALTQALPPLAEPAPRWEFARDAVARLHGAGVPILAGTDAPNPGTAAGVSVHRELELLVEAGLSPVDALAAATAVPARCFGLTDRGRIARGLYADLLLVDGDPSTDIRATRAIAGVWRRGVWVDRESYRGRLALAATLA